jgi:hypothetical protein
MPSRSGLRRGRELLFWALLLVAASPILFDTAAHLIANPWAAYCLVFWALFVREVARTPDAYAPRVSGWMLVAMGLAIEVVMVRADFLRWGRPGVALAMWGMALALGHPRKALAPLALLTVPVPTFVAALSSPQLELAYLRLAETILGPLGAAFTLAPAGHEILRIDAGAASMEYFPADGGLYVATLLFGLACYTAIREGLAPAKFARRLVMWTLLAVPIQAGAVIVAAALLLAGWPEIARLGLSLGPWMLAAAAVSMWLQRAPQEGAA